MGNKLEQERLAIEAKKNEWIEIMAKYRAEKAVKADALWEKLIKEL